MYDPKYIQKIYERSYDILGFNDKHFCQIWQI